MPGGIMACIGHKGPKLYLTDVWDRMPVTLQVHSLLDKPSSPRRARSALLIAILSTVWFCLYPRSFATTVS